MKKNADSTTELVPPSVVGGSGEEATKYIFRFKVDLGGKKRRRGGDGPQGVGPPGGLSSSSSSSSSPPPAPGGIEQYLSKTRIKLLRDKQVEERKQQQAQLQSILKQHEDQLQRQSPPSDTSLLSSASPNLDGLRYTASRTASPHGQGEASMEAKPKAGGAVAGFDVAAFLSEANAGTVHPLGAGLFHKKRLRGGSSTATMPPSRSKGSKRSDSEEEEEDSESEEQDSSRQDVYNELEPLGERQAANTASRKNENEGAPKVAKNESEGAGEGWVRSAGAVSLANSGEEGRARGDDAAAVRQMARREPAIGSSESKPIGGRRLATTAQFFPHTPPPGLAGLSSPTSSFSSLPTLDSPAASLPSSSSSSSAVPTALSSPALVPKPRATAKAGDDGLRTLRRHIMMSATGRTRPAASAATAAEKTQRTTVVSLSCQDGRHLSFVSEGLNLMKMFESYIWNYTPLHPSILHESSVRRILAGSEEDMGTPLALSVNVALASAAFWLGNAKRGNDFYRVARHHLAYLFDCSSYEVAEALVSLGMLTYGRGDLKRFGYFVHLAATICRRLGAYNSDIFAKCVIATVIDPLCPSEDKARILADYNSKAPVSPYYDSKRTIFHEHSDDVLFNERSRTLYNRYIRIRDADRHLSICWMTLKQWEQLAKAHEQRTSTKPLPQDYMDEASLTRFLKPLLQLEATLEADYLGDGFHTTIVLFRLAARARYHLMRGDEARSWHWVSRFIESLQSPHIARMGPTTVPAYQTLFDVLLHFKRVDLVRSVMSMSCEWSNLHPVCRDAVDHYLQLAEAMDTTPASIPVAGAISVLSSPSLSASSTSWRCDAHLTSTSAAAAVRVTDRRDSHSQASVGHHHHHHHLSSDRFASVTGTRHQQGISANRPTLSTTMTPTAALELVTEGRAWAEPGRESGQDIPHGCRTATDETTRGRESWSGGVSLDINERPPPPPPPPPTQVAVASVTHYATRATAEQHSVPSPMQRLVDDLDVGSGKGGRKDGRSSFDWSVFLQDLESNNT